MTVLSTATSPTWDCSSSGTFSPNQQEKSLRSVQDRLLVVKRVLSAVKRDSSNNSCVVSNGSIYEVGSHKSNLGTALSPSNKSAQGRRLESVPFDSSYTPSKDKDEGMTKLLKSTLISPTERKVRFHGKFKEMVKTHHSSVIQSILYSRWRSPTSQTRSHRVKIRHTHLEGYCHIQAHGVRAVSILGLVCHILPRCAHSHWLSGALHL